MRCRRSWLSGERRLLTPACRQGIRIGCRLYACASRGTAFALMSVPYAVSCRPSARHSAVLGVTMPPLGVDIASLVFYLHSKYCDYCGAVWKLLWSHVEIIMELYGNYYGAILKLLWSYIKIIMQLHRNECLVKV